MSLRNVKLLLDLLLDFLKSLARDVARLVFKFDDEGSLDSVLALDRWIRLLFLLDLSSIIWNFCCFDFNVLAFGKDVDEIIVIQARMISGLEEGRWKLKPQISIVEV